MVIPEYVQFQNSLEQRDREVLDRLVNRIAELTIQRGLAPGGAALAKKIQQASRGLGMQECKALAAYSMAAIASSHTSQSTNIVFADKRRTGTGTALTDLGQTAGAFASFLPGGAVIAASTSQIGSFGGKMGQPAGQSAGGFQGPGSMAGGGSNGAGSSAVGTQIQQLLISFHTQYLQLQNSMQNDNRQFTMVSNIMKAKRDTVKNTISNIH